MGGNRGNAVLREIRANLNLTQREFGRRVGMDRSWICQLERGPTQMGHRTALRIWTPLKMDFERLGLTLEDLLRGERAA